MHISDKVSVKWELSHRAVALKKPVLSEDPAAMTGEVKSQADRPVTLSSPPLGGSSSGADVGWEGMGRMSRTASGPWLSSQSSSTVNKHADTLYGIGLPQSGQTHAHKHAHMIRHIYSMHIHTHTRTLYTHIHACLDTHA